MVNEVKFLNYLQEKLGVSADDMANFLFIDKRTLYNYKAFTLEQLPYKVREKMIIFFQGHQESFIENMNMSDVLEILDKATESDLNYYRSRFLDTAAIRKKNFIVTNTKELLYKTTNKREVNYLDDFMIDFRILLEYSNLSKGYLYSLFEIIISKLNAENDYRFLDYINKYRKD